MVDNEAQKLDLTAVVELQIPSVSDLSDTLQGRDRDITHIHILLWLICHTLKGFFRLGCHDCIRNLGFLSTDQGRMSVVIEEKEFPSHSKDGGFWLCQKGLHIMSQLVECHVSSLDVLPSLSFR